MNLHWDQGTTAMRTAATGTLVAVADEDTADVYGVSSADDLTLDATVDLERKTSEYL